MASVPTPAALSNVSGDPQVLDTAGRLPATVGRAGRSTNLRGTHGPFITGGPVLETVGFQRLNNTSHTLQAHQIVGGFLFGTNAFTYTTPTGPQLDAYITNEQIKQQSAATRATYVGTLGTGYLAPLQAANVANLPVQTFRCTFAAGLGEIFNVTFGAGILTFPGGVDAAGTAGATHPVGDIGGLRQVKTFQFWKIDDGVWGAICIAAAPITNI